MPVTAQSPARSSVTAHTVVCAFSFGAALLGFGRYFEGLVCIYSMHDASAWGQYCDDECASSSSKSLLTRGAVFGMVLFLLSVAWLAPCARYSARKTLHPESKGTACSCMANIAVADVVLFLIGFCFAAAQVIELANWEWLWREMVGSCERCRPCEGLVVSNAAATTITTVPHNVCGACDLDECMNVQGGNQGVKQILLFCLVASLLANVCAMASCSVAYRRANEVEKARTNPGETNIIGKPVFVQQCWQ